MRERIRKCVPEYVTRTHTSQAVSINLLPDITRNWYSRPA